jgi:hypothetical protein
MDQRQLQTLIYNILQPLHRAKPPIYTLDMAPPLGASPEEARHWQQPVRVTEGPTVLTLGLRLAYPEKDLLRAEKLGRQMENYVAAAMKLQEGERLPIRVSAGGAFLLVEVPRPDPWRPTYPEVASQTTEAILLGLDLYGQPMALDLTQEMPGLLVTGRSGSGKTNQMRLVAAQAISKGWQLWLVDLKGGADWDDFRAAAGDRWATAEDDGIELLKELQEIVKRRNSGTALKAPRILLVVDEASNFHREREQPFLARLVKEGRSAMLRTIIGNQRVGQELHPMIKANLTWRLVGLAADESESRLATGDPRASAESLIGTGDMLYIQDGRPGKRFQGLQAGPDHVAGLLALAGVPALPAPAPLFEPWASPVAPAPLSRIPRDIMELVRIFEEAAHQASDGREVPDPWLLARANEYAIHTGQAAPFGLLRTWSRRRIGKALSKARMDEIRAWSLRIAAAFRVVPPRSGLAGEGGVPP